MEKKKNNLPFDKINYIILLAGILVIILGYTIMSMDDTQHGMGLLGLTIGPVIVMIGFLIEFFAIFYKSKENK
ncbi:MAG: DUF3098 domain-containing protein [Cyclobacteriaceae bacterium]